VATEFASYHTGINLGIKACHTISFYWQKNKWILKETMVGFKPTQL
jgi:hypothetical protein